jgi:hypothetical protein
MAEIYRQDKKDVVGLSANNSAGSAACDEKRSECTRKYLHTPMSQWNAEFFGPESIFLLDVSWPSLSLLETVSINSREALQVDFQSFLLAKPS